MGKEELEEYLRADLEPPPLETTLKKINSHVSGSPEIWSEVLRDLPRCLPNVSFACGDMVTQALSDDKIPPYCHAARFIAVVADALGEEFSMNSLKKYGKELKHEQLLKEVMKAENSLKKTCSLISTIWQAVYGAVVGRFGTYGMMLGNNEKSEDDYYRLSYNPLTHVGKMNGCIQFWAFGKERCFKICLNINLRLNEVLGILEVSEISVEFQNIELIFSMYNNPDLRPIFMKYLKLYMLALDEDADFSKAKTEPAGKRGLLEGTRQKPGHIQVRLPHRNEKNSNFTPRISQRLHRRYKDSTTVHAAMAVCAKVGATSLDSKDISSLPIGLRNTLSECGDAE
mmetsp:Transcript_31991/g.80242  ORF Transcript_31991/g.80242 Transcript_31991/m.80242 type:complete len:342 (-) Transcript_31991:65-1090(-)